MLWFAFVTGLLIPVAMVACYPVFVHWSHGEPNSWSGYRSPLAMKNTRNWREANRLCGRYWLHWGIGFGLACLLVFALLFASVNVGLELTPCRRIGNDPPTGSLVYLSRSLASSSRRARVR